MTYWSNYWWAWALFAAWWGVGTWALCKTWRYEQDLAVGDFFFCLVVSMVLGAFNLIPLLFAWEDNREGGPKIVAHKIEPEQRDR